MSRLQNFSPIPLPLICCLALACLCLAGCGDALNLEKPTPQKNYFVLAPIQNAQPSSGPGKDVLAIKPLNAAPDFNSRELVYRLQGDQYATDYYNLLLTSPTNQLTSCLQNWLSQSGVFKFVITANSELEPSYILEASLRQMYGDFRDNVSPSAVISLQVFLLEEQDYAFQVVFAKNFQKTVALEARTPEALVEGFNTALADILRTLENDLRVVVAQSKETTPASNTADTKRKKRKNRVPALPPQ